MISKKRELLLENGRDWYVVEYKTGELVVKHRSNLTSILDVGRPMAEFGIIDLTECGHGASFYNSPGQNQNL